MKSPCSCRRRRPAGGRRNSAFLSTVTFGRAFGPRRAPPPSARRSRSAVSRSPPSPMRTRGVRLQLLGDLAHRLGPRRGEHQSLARARAHPQDLPDLRLEAHVEHAIRLVQDHVGRVRRAHRRREPGGRRQEIVQPPGRRDDDVRAGPQRPQLVALTRAAVQGDRSPPPRANYRTRRRFESQPRVGARTNALGTAAAGRTAVHHHVRRRARAAPRIKCSAGSKAARLPASRLRHRADVAAAHGGGHACAWRASGPRSPA